MDRSILEIYDFYHLIPPHSLPLTAATPDIVVVLTDGQSNSYSSTVASAASLLSTGVRVFAVGVGSNLNFGELKAMASDPDCTHLSLLRSFDDFDALVKQIEKRVCNGELCLLMCSCVSVSLYLCVFVSLGI